MHGRFAVALAWSGMATVLLAGCSSGDRAATDSLRADSAATAMAPAGDTAASGAGALTSEITAAENAWRIAVSGGDTVELGRITAPGFTMPGATSTSTVNRSTLMSQVSQGILAADSSRVRYLTVNGTADSATANLTFFWRVSRNGKAPKAETMNVTDTWVKRDGRWQLAARRPRS